MSGVRQIGVAFKPRFLATNQFRLDWRHFTESPTQPMVRGTPVHATVSMVCEFAFEDNGHILVLLGSDRKWRLGQIVVQAVMVKSRSFVHAPQLRKNTPQQNAALLRHERVHVELGERHARTIWKHVQQLAVTAPDAATAAQKLVNAAHSFRTQHMQKCAMMNDRYDQETDHGRNSKQMQWNQLYLTVENTNGTL